MIRVPIAKPYLDEKEEHAVVEVLRTGWISQGPRCMAFEKALAAFVGVPCGRAVNSGTSAIQLALLACGVRPGDDVILPAFTCVATLHPVVAIGARPVLVDIETETFSMDPARAIEAVTARTRAILVVHLFGLTANIEPILEIASRRDLVVIEDAALGLGAALKGRQAGSFGDAACLSFHPRKMITTGEGGMVLTPSERIAALVSELRNYGASVSAWERHGGPFHSMPACEQVGYNYKLTDIQATIGLEQLRKLPQMLALRRGIASRYDGSLAELDWMRTPQVPPGFTHAYQSYVCLLRHEVFQGRVERNLLRVRLCEHLASRGIASVQGAQALPAVDFYRRKHGWNPRDFPMAMEAEQMSIALPIFPGLTDSEQDQVLDSMRSFVP